MGETQTIHQFLAGATSGDAITDHALTIQNWLHEMGYRSRLYAWHVEPAMRDRVQPWTAYRRGADEHLAIYHHSIGSDSAEFLRRQRLNLILIYHNITPGSFMQHIDPAWAQALQRGRAQLDAIKPQIVQALGVSPLNARELQAMGFDQPGILPIAVDADAYDLPDDAETAQLFAQRQPLLLFVGRFAPNKKQEDLVKLLAYYSRIRPNAHLALIGDPWTVGYDRWVRDQAVMLGVAPRLIMPGKVSQQVLVTAYRHASLYVSMSEHEGFGKPLIESMLFGLPVLAYASSGVPDTVGHAGILFHDKALDRIAAAADVMIHDTTLRSRLSEAGRRRVRQFLAGNVRHQFAAHIKRVTTG